ncbi:MAG TPA: hypothetical protein VFM54_11725 [Micromonosporaceae bacterium]|nr:hypothetical protein [Micromonosporaceae bacterium]
MNADDDRHINEYAREAMAWHGWGSPVGLGIGISLVTAALGFFLWMLHLAGLL